MTTKIIKWDLKHSKISIAPPVRFSAVPEVKRRKSVEAGCPIILQCEISDSTAQVQWYKDGDQLLVESGVDIKSDDCMRTLSIQSAHPSHAGVYSCTTKDDVIKFQVEIRGDLPSLFLTYKLTLCLLAIMQLTITTFCVLSKCFKDCMLYITSVSFFSALVLQFWMIFSVMMFLYTQLLHVILKQ